MFNSPLDRFEEEFVEDGIIDLGRYREGAHEEDGGTFAVWGGEGERTRFALPVWRGIFLVGGDRGGIVRCRDAGLGEEDPRPLFVLDLGREPARLAFPSPAGAGGGEAPAITDVRGGGGVAVLLGSHGGWRWYMEILGKEVGGLPEGEARETLLFLAGECAGLLFYRGFAEGGAE